MRCASQISVCRLRIFSVQQFLEVRRVFAQGAHGHLLRLRVIPVTQVSGANARAGLVRRRAVGKVAVPRLAASCFSVIECFLMSDMGNLK